jgi:hypothetical protein
MGEEGPEAEQVLSRTRGRVALAATLLLGGLVAAVVVASSSGPSGASEAPRDCVRAWNADPGAIDVGVHNSVSHGYRDVQVGYMPEDGAASLSGDPQAGECAVVFAARRLDPEPEAAGQIQRGDRWAPLSGLLAPADLARLQIAAVAEANATVTGDGALEEAGTR